MPSKDPGTLHTGYSAQKQYSQGVYAHQDVEPRALRRDVAARSRPQHERLAGDGARQGILGQEYVCSSVAVLAKAK